MKNRTFRESIRCALRGIKTGFRTEKNFKYYIGIALVMFALNILARVSIMEYIIFVVLAFLEFALEYLNTAIEYLADKVSKEYNSQIGMAKDVAAAAVLINGFAFFLAEGLILIPKLIAWLQ